MEENQIKKLVKDKESMAVKKTLVINGSSQFNWQLKAPFNFIEKGDIAGLRAFVQDNFYEDVDIQGNTMMHHAARLKQEDIVGPMIDELIRMNVSVNATNKMGRTPLHVAVEQNNLLMVRKLLQEGANPNQGDINGLTAVHVATRCADVPVLRALRAYGADFNATDKWGKTPLFDAASSNKAVNVAELMLFRCDVNAVDRVGNTALFYASWIGLPDVVRILCFYGADTLSQNKHGKTPIDIAEAEGHTELVEFMSRYTPSASMNRLIQNLDGRIDEIKEMFEKLPKTQTYANDVKYSMIRASARLMEVEKFLKTLIERGGEYKQPVKAHQPVVSHKPINFAKEKDSHSNE